MKNKYIHFIGIGGVGISALAKLYFGKGFQISGTNDSESPQTLDYLRKNGVNISLDLNPNNLPKADLYIYSDAWLANNFKVLEEAKKRGVPVKSYFEALGEIANSYKVIAISGAHGKTTTTAMAIDLLEDAEFDPTGVVGSLRAKTKSNFRSGKSKYFVVEADEYMRHFLQFKPQILIITNIDEDHLDYYKDLKDIQSAFNELAKKVPKDGFIICDPNDEKVKPALQGVIAKIINYRTLGDQVSKMGLKVPGEHNRKNAMAVMALADVLGIDEKIARKALTGFAGTWRRFEYKGELTNGTLLYDDYAHHPKEIEATLNGARELFPNKKIIVIFQPHLYSRTRILLNDFSKALSCADRIILTSIYAAREKDDGTVSSFDLEKKIKENNRNIRYISRFEDIVSEIKGNASKEDVVITMGAGDIYKVGEMLL